MKKVLKGIVSSNIKITAVFREDSDGYYSAECPEIPGCIVVGRSKLDATKKIKAAVEGCLSQLLSDAKQKIRGNKTRGAGRS